MSYVVIARRWRPQQFDDIIAQDHVSKTLSNAITKNRIAHSYIFTGPRGVGKTTTARILAKALNCEKGPVAKPCNECSSCKSITTGNSMDVLEIDGASNRGIDEIRNLRESIRYTPSTGQYRIYIIDEVHMLTKEAFNALLKTLEEPPAHALFIFATTEIHRVPATILSRCQRFDFRRIPLKTIMEHLRRICEKDGIDIDEDAMLQIAKKADGSMRDSQSILDQIISFSGTTITFEQVAQALGVIHQDIYFQITDCIRSRDLKGLIVLARDIFNTGYDLTEFLLGLEDHLRNILVLRTTDSADLLDVSETYITRYREIAREFSENDLIGYLQSLAQTALAVKNSQQPTLKFELGLLKLAKMPQALEVETILQKLELLKKKAPKPGLDTSQASSGSPEAALPATQPLTLKDILQKWPDVITAVHAKRPTYARILENASAQNYSGGVLELTSPNDRSLVEARKKWLENIISKILGEAITLKMHYSTKKQEKGKGASAGTAQEKKSEVEKLRSESPLVAKIIDELDLDIV